VVDPLKEKKKLQNSDQHPTCKIILPSSSSSIIIIIIIIIITTSKLS